ncbi:MAG: response regulator [Anaerolineae bacterium]|nr:MAG: response regulator [Anaerolineae bacterium]
MPRILIVDDDPILVKLLETTMSRAGYTTLSAKDGKTGLRIAKSEQPDLIILDVMMPGMDGFEVARQIRRSTTTSQIMILMLTASSDANNKVQAFSIGVDDYLTKPFEISELVTRVSTLLRRSEQVRKGSMVGVAEGRLVAVHSLRGGLGCSSLAINLAVGMKNLWSKPTILVDNVFTSGQIALLLDTPVNRTWIDFAEIAEANYSEDALYSSISIHESGLHFLASPSDPVEADRVDHFAVKAAISILRRRYEYIVADLAHDFSNRTLEVLEAADKILLLLGSEIISVRLAAMTLRIYKEFEFQPDKVQIVLVQHSKKSFLKKKEIEQALQRSIAYSIPYAAEAADRAIATGVPYLTRNPGIPASSAVEDIAYLSSKPIHLENPPAKPSNTWQRVSSRNKLSTRKNRKGKLGLPLFRKAG